MSSPFHPALNYFANCVVFIITARENRDDNVGMDDGNNKDEAIRARAGVANIRP